MYDFTNRLKFLPPSKAIDATAKCFQTNYDWDNIGSVEEETSINSEPLIKNTKWKTNLIKEDINWTNIGGTNSCHREKSMSPFPTVYCSLIEVEQSLQPSRNAWINTE